MAQISLSDHQPPLDKQQHQLASSSSLLKPSAIEFRPAAAATAQPPPPLPHYYTGGTDGSYALAYEFDAFGMSTKSAVEAEERRRNQQKNGPPGFSSSSSSRFHPPAQQQQHHHAFLAVLQQQFPEYSPTALLDIFTSNGRDLAATVDILYSIENEIYGMKQHSTQGTAPSSHQQPPPVKKKEEEIQFSTEDFPSLGGGSKANSSSATSIVVPLGVNYAGKAKAAAHVAPPAIPSRSQPSTSSSFTSRGGFNSGGGAAAPAWQAAGVVTKFSTGATVAAEYVEARSDARDHARLRNVCFEQATQAYLLGNKALAKELGAKGRWHNERMKTAHAAAASETFNRRNSSISSNTTNNNGGGGSLPPTLDLHGLHVNEAIHHLQRSLDQFQSEKRVHIVRVVVGVGQHGKVPARLPAAVRTFLKEHGLRFRETYEGMLDVTL